MSSDVRKADASSPYGRTLKYSVDEKLAIINHAKSHGNRAAGREFNVAESSIREWRKNEVKLINNKHSSAGVSSVGNTSVNNNNNNNPIKRGTVPINSQNNLIRLRETAKTNEEFMRGLAHYATLTMLNIDMNLTHMAPILQLQQQNVQQLPESSAASSVGTPSSEGSSPPPSTSPISANTTANMASCTTSGSSRRKLKCPQKISVEQRAQDPNSE